LFFAPKVCGACFTVKRHPIMGDVRQSGGDEMIDSMLAGGTVNAREFGNGAPLVLFHSLLAERSSFDGVIEGLAEHFRVVVPELPGFGDSAPVSGGLDAVADRMAEALRDIDGPVRLLGNGYGGFVALLLTIRHPELVSRLVLADAGACFSEPGRAAFRGMAAGATAKGLEGIADVAMRRLFAADFHAANPDLVAARRALFLQSRLATIVDACEALASLDLRPALAGVAIPVLAVVGAQDEATPKAMSEEAVKLLPNAHLRILDGLAHVPQLQAPEVFLKSVLPFLQSER
jgi:3-oxoadipate enol-lactonase